MQKEIKELKELIRDLIAAEERCGKKMLSFNEAVDYLDVSKSFLYKLTSQGKITHYKPNNKLIYFKKRDLDDFLRRNRFEGHTTDKS
ncbi:helix-turn-helix domain-containing protein [Gramella sp. KN1008]|uniref:helix-turn-helix domain-containing protein n=1 Tax=Gramella sp. KN1008 TaxID=2529298 RepID=UPI0010403A13|nr:helix-turn-helix domain-containing protein [Gramella sp. KN1008]TBW25817.1 DNA-binding protein [Gramella sp. KN1008]